MLEEKNDNLSEEKLVTDGNADSQSQMNENISDMGAEIPAPENEIQNQELNTVSLTPEEIADDTLIIEDNSGFLQDDAMDSINKVNAEES